MELSADRLRTTDERIKAVDADAYEVECFKRLADGHLAALREDDHSE